MACGVNEGTEMDADIDKGTLLGRELAVEACGTDEDDGEHECESWLQQTSLQDKEDDQRDKNTQENLPSTYGLPLEGEWTVYASGEATDSRSDADVLNAAIEHASHPSESKETKDTKRSELEGHREGTSEQASVDELEEVAECCQQLCMADGNPG